MTGPIFYFDDPNDILEGFIALILPASVPLTTINPGIGSHCTKKRCLLQLQVQEPLSKISLQLTTSGSEDTTPCPQVYGPVVPPYIYSPLPRPSGVRQLFDDPTPLSEDSRDFWVELLTAPPISACLEFLRRGLSITFERPLILMASDWDVQVSHSFLFILRQRLQIPSAVAVLARVNPLPSPHFLPWVFGPQTLAAYATTVLPLVLQSPSLEPSTPLVQGIASITASIPYSLPLASARRQPCKVACAK